MLWRKADAITLPSIKGDVEFKDVSFSYDGEKRRLKTLRCLLRLVKV